MRRVTVNNETYNSPEQDYYWLDADTYFDIQDNIDLGGDTLYGVKESSIFAFHGGSLSNGMIYGVLNVEAGAYQIFQNNVDLNNSELMIKAPYILPEWFGAGTGTDDYAALKLAFDIAARSSQIVRLTGQYSLGNNAEPLVVDKNCTLLFAGGSLQNGILGGYINLKTESNDIFGNNLTFAEGTEMNVPYLRPEWFGAKGDAVMKTTRKEGATAVSGDYDYFTGTDDTEAINHTIRTAERLSIKTIKFNAANYLVSREGIIIARGNVILEGSGALLTEMQGYNYKDLSKTTGEILKQDLGYLDSVFPYKFDTTINQNIDRNIDISPISSKTSTICCNNGSRCISCYEGKELKIVLNNLEKDRYVHTGVADPIYIKDLQFISDNKPFSTSNTVQQEYDETYHFDGKYAVAIDFKASYSGPTWPIIIERCYFRGFAISFFIDSEISYPLHCLTFRDNAFFANNYCVYAKENGYVTKNPDNVINLYEGPWAFEFVDNRCHQNAFLIRICVQKGLCLIENNNTEGTLGFTNINKESKDFVDTPDEYAIDIQLAQKAVARICHNHFESNRTRLIKVVGYYDADNRAIVTESNTDGTYETLNKCYFANVTLETDMNAIIKDCFIENKLPNTKELTLEDVFEGKIRDNDNGVKEHYNHHYFNTAYLRHRGNKHIEGIPQMVIDRNISDGVGTFVTTPYGRKMMSCYYWKEPGNDSIVISDINIQNRNEELRYLTFEIPCYREGDRTIPLYMNVYLSLDDKNDKKYSYEPLHYIGCSRAGFYWVRAQIDLEQYFLTNLHVELRISVQDFNNYIYLGAVTYTLTDHILDINMPLNSLDFERQITGANNESFLLKEGDRFTLKGFDVTCLKEGFYAPSTHEFFAYKEDGIWKPNVIVCKPVIIGSRWICDYGAFTISDLVSRTRLNQDGSVNDNGQYLKYYVSKTFIEEPETSAIVGTSVHPVLYGRGVSQLPSNKISVPYICEGSTYICSSKNEIYSLINGEWVKM